MISGRPLAEDGVLNGKVRKSERGAGNAKRVCKKWRYIGQARSQRIGTDKALGYKKQWRGYDLWVKKEG